MAGCITKVVAVLLLLLSLHCICLRFKVFKSHFVPHGHDKLTTRVGRGVTIASSKAFHFFVRYLMILHG